MKYISTALIIIILSFPVAAQVVRSVPQFATENDSTVVIFDATKGNRGLIGFTGDIYAHTGLITDMSSGPTDWQNVIGPWGVNNAKVKLVRVGTDLYHFTIGFPKDFYPTQDPYDKILKLAFVFWAELGSLSGREEDGGDIFLNLFDKGIHALYIEPLISAGFDDPKRSPFFLDSDDSVKIIGSAAAIETQISNLLLKIEGIEVAQDTLDTLSFEFVAADYGEGIKEVELFVTDSSGNVDSSSLFIMVNPAVTSAAPPAGTKPGINYIDATTVRLALFAPNKKNVYLIGDFNDWQFSPEYFMNKYSFQDTSLFWLTLTGITPGVEYGFQYLVDGKIRIADPFTDKTLDQRFDPGIPSITYPSLKPYPTGKTEEVTSVFQTNQTPFNWQNNDSYIRPKQEELIIYELLLRDFVANHNYETLIDTLDYLENLGINAIELMPFNEFDNNSAWGYNPSFYFAPDKYYGTKDALKTFIDEAHRRGIAVIMDIVLNHTTGVSPMLRLYWNGTLNRPAADNPWYNEDSPAGAFNFGPDFNHQSFDTKYFIDRVNSYWLSEYNVDGFRFDFTKGFTNRAGDGGAQDDSRIALLKRMADKVWETDSTAYVILEHFAENSEEIILSNYKQGMLLWGNLNFNYRQAAMGWNSNGASDFSWGYYGKRGWTKAHLITYMESHDEERLMYENLQFGNSSGDYDIKDLNTALERNKMTAAFFLMYPGPKMIWQFGEVGYDVDINFNGRVGEKPIRWNYFQDENRRKLYDTYRALLNIRKNYEVFRSPETEVIMGVRLSVKRIHLSHSTMDAVIVGNFNVVESDLSPLFQQTGWWYDFFSGDSLFVENTDSLLHYYPGEFHIYTTERLPAPDPDLITGIDDISDKSIPESYKIHQNYPNPFNPVTTIDFTLPVGGKTSLVIYNILGQEVSKLVDEFLPASDYSFRWDASSNPSGIYIYLLKTEEKVFSRKMLLIK